MRENSDVLVDVNKKREILQKESNLYQEAVHFDLARLNADAKKIGTTLLLVGGACAVAYLITRAIWPGKGKKEKQVTPASADVMTIEPKRESDVVRMIKEQIALFLIAIVKEKLTAYLNSLEKKQ